MASGRPVEPCRRSSIHIARLSLTGFRNHAQTVLELEPGLNVFEGANGHGKSNLLEAVYMLAIAKSPRTSSERELVNWKIGETGGHVQVMGVAREGGDTVQAQIDFESAALQLMEDDLTTIISSSVVRTVGENVVLEQGSAPDKVYFSSFDFLGEQIAQIEVNFSKVLDIRCSLLASLHPRGYLWSDHAASLHPRADVGALVPFMFLETILE